MEMNNKYFRSYVPERLAGKIAQAAGRLENERIVRRIRSRDWTVWKKEDEEISNRLGWLDAPECPPEEIAAYQAFAAELRKEGTSRVVLLGMGGSSLAAEAFGRILDHAAGFPELEVLDTTAPESVLGSLRLSDMEKTLFIVSSKSGTTAESNALLALFYKAAVDRLGPDKAGRRFAAVTDPGSPLETVAAKLGFRGIFHGKKDIGGRFSALTAFGLLPAACSGIAIERLLASAAEAAAACRLDEAALNPGAFLGLLMGVSALNGADKLMVSCPPRLKPAFDWLEQLTAESTGKEGKGIIPIRLTVPRAETKGGADGFFVEFRDAAGDPPPADNSPRAIFDIRDPDSLGGLFFIWETAVAIACHFLGINPFDQPDVEASKRKTREFINSGPGKAVESGGPDLGDFLKQAGPGSYIAIQAFLPPSDGLAKALDDLADDIAARTGRPVTVGFGPRFLHSTGQLHKGGANTGLFIQLVSDSRAVLAIPEVPGVPRPAASFEALFTAQAWGDLTALREKGRRAIRLRLPGPDADSLRELAAPIP